MYCNDKPEKPGKKKEVWRKINDMARANSLWVTAYGTGCGAIELRPSTPPGSTWSVSG